MTTESTLSSNGMVHDRIAAIADSVTELDALLQELVTLRDRLNLIERDAVDSRDGLLATAPMQASNSRPYRSRLSNRRPRLSGCRDGTPNFRQPWMRPRQRSPVSSWPRGSDSTLF
jgi:hypothetical protein